MSYTNLPVIILVNLAMVLQIAGIEHINSVCPEGFVMWGNNECEPLCDPVCSDFASCVGPQTCECFLGYIMNPQTKECELECDGDTFTLDRHINQCVLKKCSCLEGGYCLDNSDVCVCHKGYRKTSNTTCEPECQPKCKNANCVGPNQCKCWPGYDGTEVSSVCEANFQNLLALNECHCKTDYFPYAIGILALVISLILVVLHFIERRRHYYVKVIRQQEAPIPLVEDESGF